MSGPSQNLTDEQLAAALQQQYRMEFLQRQERHQQRHSQQDLTRMATAPASTEVVYNGSSDEVYARQLQRQMDREAASQSMPSPPHRIQNVGFQNNYSHIRPDAPQSRPDAPSNNGDIEDAILAQQMQDEELARQYSRRYNQQQQTRSTDTLFDDYTQTHATHDLETQRHLSQQLADAELAQQLAEREQAEALRRDREQRSQLENQSKWYRRILPLFILAAAITIPLLFVFGVFSKNDVPFLGGFGSDWVDSDPWSDVGSFNVDESGNSNVAVGDNAVRWATNGNGLQLEIWNAMEDKYDSLFATAVQNWDAGAPIDSLSLSTRKVNYDFECKDQDGILKICSGNYGATKWRGLNEVKLNSQTKVIVSSVAKMNNYYLDTESQEQRLYTICHELGHGFGLPHWVSLASGSSCLCLCFATNSLSPISFSFSKSVGCGFLQSGPWQLHGLHHSTRK